MISAFFIRRPVFAAVTTSIIAFSPLLFVGGIMNLVWIAGLAILVLIEKLAPWRDPLGRPDAQPGRLGQRR